VWVRMWAANANDNSIFLAVSTSAPPQTPATTMTLPAPQSNGTWVWTDSGALSIAAGVQNLSIYMAKDGVAIDALYIVTGAGTPPATVTPLGNTWAYAASANTYQPATCNGHDYDASTDSTFATGTAPSCYANDSGLVGGTEFSLVRFSGQAEKAAAVYANTQPLTAGDVAEAVVWATAQPPHVNINVIELMPVVQSFAPFQIQRS